MCYYTHVPQQQQQLLYFTDHKTTLANLGVKTLHSHLKYLWTINRQNIMQYFLEEGVCLVAHKVWYLTEKSPLQVRSCCHPLRR